ncbi:hypothetical protein I3760_06G162200 [Carya illinoinensis]|uniref:Uncharacterized protein n=1 Tax=Carya illinoinensis TaxID=32201 RepID=A0A8T1QC71_CARIL|nr:hypothetical protein I3760_06G162200 [Carya illinoinensis]KAG6652118.1 hypothetical protein CIPAW_06G161000 [Carya illinoinensis]
MTQSAASDDASSITHLRHTTASTESNNLQYVNFNVASFSKKQLGELKACIAAELNQIRQLRHRLKSPPIPDQTHAQPPSKKSNKLEHKNEWIFNEPVDVAGMGLHDYHDIIKQPMDLGTVKLAFTNALTYNPKVHTVHAMAEQLLSRFEELFRPVGEQIERPDEEDGEKWVFDAEEELEASDNNNPNSMQFAKRSEQIYIEDKVSNHSEPLQGNHASSLNQPMMQPSIKAPPSSMKAPPVKPVKQPKPKAKDPNKREMSLEEKHKLGIGLQSLPPEKMKPAVQIIKKRNEHLKQDEDEIELDIEAVDTETLWELDRLITNWKKMVSKIKRQALMGNYAKTNGLIESADGAIFDESTTGKASEAAEAQGEEPQQEGNEPRGEA